MNHKPFPLLGSYADFYAGIVKRDRIICHYTNPIPEAIRQSGWRGDYDRHRVHEDVREKLCLDGRRGLCYYSNRQRGLYLTFHRDWFAKEPMLLNPDELAVPVSADVVVKASHEYILRRPHMVTRVAAAGVGRDLSGFDGLAAEEAIRSWLMARYPALIKLPPNSGKYDQPCDHDFVLCYQGRNLKCDVSTVPLGYYKNPVDVHLFVSKINGNELKFQAFEFGDRAKEVFWPILGRSPLNFLMAMQCEADGLPYSELREIAESYRH